MRFIFPVLAFAAAMLTMSSNTRAETKTAVFAGGCFWCMESEFQDKAGVSDVVSCYAGGPDTKNAAAPTYEQVSTGETGFHESVRVTYDSTIVSYQQLLDIFWRNIDPTDARGQFCDKGTQYLAAIFYGSADEEKMAKESLAKVQQKLNVPIATQIIPYTNFFAAEEYHQDFYKTHAVHYKLYRNGCGRDARLEELNGKE